MTTPRTALDRGAAVTGLLTVVAANGLYLAGLSRILDFSMSMEAFYIAMAQDPVARILADDPAWGPLYALWLKPFRAVLGDPAAVYTANMYVVSFGVSILLYLYLLLLTRRAAVAVGAALFFLISDLNVPLPSKASAFAVMVTLAGLTASELVPGGARRMSVAAAGVLLASYARPELYPAALCLGVAALWLARREATTSARSVLAWPATGLAMMVLVGIWIGTPVFSPYHNDDRLLIAFREHFAWNWSRWHDHWEYFQSIWEQEFGGAQTMLQALQNNPRAICRHLADNLLGTVRFLVESAFDHYPLLVPATYPALVKAENLAVAAGAFGSLIFVAVRPRLRRQMLDRYGHALYPYAAMAAFSGLSATVIFPLAHYLVIPGVLLLLVGTLAVTLIIPAGGVLSRPTQVLAALVCLAAVPRPFVLPSAYVVAGSPFKGQIAVTRTVADTIDFIRSLRLPAPVHVLTITDGIGEMLGDGFEETKVWQKGPQPLEDYIRDHHIDLIVTLEPGRNSFVVEDPYWRLVQSSPVSAGFTRLSVPNHDTARVYLRTDLVQRAAGSGSAPGSGRGAELEEVRGPTDTGRLP